MDVKKGLTNCKKIVKFDLSFEGEKLKGEIGGV
jgi:hypothetical protein